MNAFNKELLNNTFLRVEAEDLYGAGFMNKEQLHLIEKNLVAYHSNGNIFARVGLFILGCFLFSASCSFIALVTTLGGNEHFGTLLLVDAVLGFVALEFIIRSMKYYGNGIDDSFSFCAQGCLIGFLFYSIPYSQNAPLIYILATVISVICCIRYIDRLSALIGCFSIVAFTVEVSLKTSLGTSLLPFTMMILSAIIYIIAIFLRKKHSDYYLASLNICLSFCAVLFYLSGNYFVVRELNTLLLDATIAIGEDIPFAILFYTFTFICPALYIYFSLKKKNRTLLWIGFFALAFSIFTIRYYYHILPTEIALIFGSFSLFAIAFFAMKKLTLKTSGLTFEQDRFNASNELLIAQALIIIHKHAVDPSLSGSSGISEGGGEFGGAGSGDKF